MHYSNANSIIKESTLTVGLSVIDILTGKLKIYEYQHPYINNPTTYDQLEKYIAIYNPSEVIIIANSNTDKFIEQAISFANINAQKIHKIYLQEGKSEKNMADFERIATNCEKQRFQETLIDKIYGIGSFQEKMEFYNYSIANQSLCFLLDFIETHNPSLIKNIDYPVFENHADKLVLANHSLKQLNIINDQRFNGKLSCVANFLNNCVTNAGRRRFNQDLLHPICDTEQLNSSYGVIDHLIHTKFYKHVRESLTNVRDIEKIERKLMLKKMDPKDFVILYNNLSTVLDLFQILKNDTENLDLFNYITEFIPHNIDIICQDIIKFTEERFNIEKSRAVSIDKLSNYSLEELFFINKKYDENLNILLKNSVDSREQFEAISRFFSELVGDYEKPRNRTTKTKKDQHKENASTPIQDNSSSETGSETGSGAYVKIHETPKNDAMLLITKRRAMILKDIVAKLIEKSGQHYGITYRSKFSGVDEILNLDLAAIEYKMHGNNQTTMVICSGHINEIAHSIQNSKDILVSGISQVYGKILNEFCERISQDNHESKLSIVSRFIGLVDLCHCKAYNAVKYNYCRPQIIEQSKSGETGDIKSYVNFKKMRHCLIEHINTKELYVTNDLELHRGMLLYGTNAVGKTSFIKSIGISIVLAQAGMFVPCEEFIYYPYQYLFTRILGNDNIFKGLSTFAVEMSELRTILKQATKNSIILGDELCSGTESTSALSIFVSSLERLHTISSTFLFATHFHEILEYEEIKLLDKMQIFHMSVIYDREQNELIYDRKLRKGAGEAMYGLEVCKSLDLPDDFIERAYQIRNKYCKTGGIGGEKVMEAKKSRYNAKKLRGMCEICNNNPGTEVHHLQFQKNADIKGIINGEFKKHHKANLINICEECHNKIHESEQEYKIAKTTKGYKLMSI